MGLAFGKSKSKNCALRYPGAPICQGRARKARKKMTDGDFKMSTKTKIALAAALILGTASAALANDSDDEKGGFVVPGSMDGVNPVYHPDIFGNTRNADQAYGSVAAPKPNRPIGLPTSRPRIASRPGITRARG